MSNMFKRVALAFGRFTGLKRETQVDLAVDLFDPGASPVVTCDSPDAGQSAACDAPSLDTGHNPWDEALATSDELARKDTDAAIEAAIAGGQLEDLSPEFKADAIEPTDAPLIVAAIEPATETTIEARTESIIETKPEFETAVVAETTAIAEAAPITETTPTEVAVVAEAPAVVAAVEEKPASETPTPAIVEEAKPIIEMKPDPLSAPIPNPQANVTFTQLYELISGEVSKRTDSAVNVYERLLSATREELEATRRNNRVAWTVGGVMTAVAAIGAVWTASEVSANHVEFGSLRQQVQTAQQVSLERDQLRNDLLKSREASAKMEINLLKARLDQALSVTAERDRLKDEVQSLRQAKQETESELRVARSAAATQPVSQARPAAVIDAANAVARQLTADTAAGSERPDVWSMLLDGK
jgi:hypothetical protein